MIADLTFSSASGLISEAAIVPLRWSGNGLSLIVQVKGSCNR